MAKQEIELLHQGRQRDVLLGGLLLFFVAGLFSYLVVRGKAKHQRVLALRDHKLRLQEIEELKQEQHIVALDNMLLGETRERTKIAQDLQESLSALLSSAKLHAKDASIEWCDDEMLEDLHQVSSTIDFANNEVMRIAADMAPTILISQGLVHAIQQLVRTINNLDSLKVDVEPMQINESLISTQQKIALYRILQETIQNAMKHANASHLTIKIWTDLKSINLSVCDNGEGFDPDQLENENGIGLKSIHSRVDQLDGTLHIHSSPGGPTEIEVNLPQLQSQEL